MKLKNLRLFGGRGIRSFSLWLTLWGAVACLISWIYPFDLCSNHSAFVSVCHLSVFLNPVSLALLMQLSSDIAIQYLLPFLHPFVLYALGRFLDRRILEKRTHS